MAEVGWLVRLHWCFCYQRAAEIDGKKRKKKLIEIATEAGIPLIFGFNEDNDGQGEKKPKHHPILPILDSRAFLAIKMKRLTFRLITTKRKKNDYNVIARIEKKQ